ncbi:MAG: hypothetical protein ACJ79H_09015 [Myxococcales bacterium]
MRRAALLLCLFACKPAAPPPGAAGPVEAVQEFAAALQRGDPAGAHALLSSRTQREAEQIAARARTVAGDAGGVPESGRQMLFGSALPQGKADVHEISRQADVAQIEVVDKSGRARTYRVVREGGLWKVDLDLLSADGGG